MFRNMQLFLIGFNEVQNPLVLICKVKFYLNPLALINVYLLYQGNDNPAFQMIYILIFQECPQIRIIRSNPV